MDTVRKVPYYTMESSLNPFADKTWKGYSGRQGCVPLNTQKTVSMDRLAPGEPAPPPKPMPPKLTPQQRKTRKEEEARQEWLAQQAKKQQQNKPKEEKPSEPKALEAEECEKPPVFDMLDIPDTMEKIKWPVSAKLARRWFSNPKHIYNDDKHSVQPIDDKTITLDWVMKFGNVREKLNELLSKSIYSEAAAIAAKTIVNRKLTDLFVNQRHGNLSFTTSPFLDDLRKFHIDWQFQLMKITAWDTLDGLYLTDLSGSLANFAIYVAIGNVVITGDQYYKYDGKAGTKTYCRDPIAEISHIYVYINDNYSFNDKKGYRSSQYLGHWNKRGIILTNGGRISTLTNNKLVKTEFGNSREVETDWNEVVTGFDKPVDTRKRIFRKFRKSDVYFPIHNRDYRAWREKHHRGGDVMIYSKPKYMKLKNPIRLTLETICSPPEKM